MKWFLIFDQEDEDAVAMVWAQNEDNARAIYGLKNDLPNEYVEDLKVQDITDLEILGKSRAFKIPGLGGTL